LNRGVVHTPVFGLGSPAWPVVAWPLLRRIRLCALKDSPKAFAPQGEPRWSPREWVETFEDGVWLVARAGSDVVGLLRSKPDPDRSWSRYVEAAWVAPGHRRRGVLRSLLCTEARRSARHGVRQLELWVFDDNCDAYQAYKSLGFLLVPKDPPQRLAGRWEHRLRLLIG